MPSYPSLEIINIGTLGFVVKCILLRDSPFEGEGINATSAVGQVVSGCQYFEIINRRLLEDSIFFSLLKQSL
jgi:hypothetical protein